LRVTGSLDRTTHDVVCTDVCVFITAGPIKKLFAGGGGGKWTTCTMIDDEPTRRPVWKLGGGRVLVQKFFLKKKIK